MPYKPTNLERNRSFLVVYFARLIEEILECEFLHFNIDRTLIGSTDQLKIEIDLKAPLKKRGINNGTYLDGSSDTSD